MSEHTTDGIEDGPESEPVDAKLPLDAWHRGLGARMVSFAGYEMPIQYPSGIMAEHNWTREAASLFDVSHMGQLMVTGEGAGAALEAILPGNIASIGEGRMRYSLLLNELGTINDDLMVTRRGDGFYLVVNGATKWDDIGHLAEHLPDDVTLNHMAEHALLALQGPRAVEVLSGLLPGVEALFFMQAAAFPWNDQQLWISRSGYTGEDGFEISIPEEFAEAFATALVEHEAVKPAGLGARDSLRLEAGLPLYGHDLDYRIDPVEARLTFAISPRRRVEGGFIGAERVLEFIREGRGMYRVGMTLDGRAIAREGAQIFETESSEHSIGTVTSGAFSPTIGKPIAMGYVDFDMCDPGTQLFLEVRGKRLSATVVALPFVPHRYHRQGAA